MLVNLELVTIRWGNCPPMFAARSCADDEEWAGLAEQLPPALPWQVLQYYEALSIYNQQNFPISLREWISNVRHYGERFVWPHLVEKQCCGSVTFWYGSGSANQYHWLKDLDPDPILLFSSVAFKMPTKNKFFWSFFAYYFLILHLLHLDQSLKI